MIERLTHSKRSSWQFCNRQFWLRYEQGLDLAVQKGGRRRGTIFGGALQAARDQAALLASDPAGESVEADSMFAPVAVAMDAIDEAYAELDATVNSQADADSIEVERVKIRVMVRAYMDRYGMRARREVEYELPFRNPLSGGYSKTFRIAGKIDGLEVVGQQRARIVEDKFVAQMQKAMIDRLVLDQQATEYVEAVMSKGWTAEVAYRHTRYPSTNPKKEKVLKTKTHPAETLDEYEARLEQDVLDRPEFYFDEQLLQFPTSQMDEFRQERWGIAQQIIAARASARRGGQQAQAYPKNPTRCWEYGGCIFIPLCAGWPDAGDRYVKRSATAELSPVEGEEGDGYGDD